MVSTTPGADSHQSDRVSGGSRLERAVGLGGEEEEEGDQVDETTALLGSSKGPHASVNGVSPSTPDDDSVDDPDEDKPLNKVQVLLLCYARAVEPLAFFSIFPYISQMVRDNAYVSDADVGFYSGLIESLFSLTQALVLIFWGRAADRVGRRPVLVLSLFGVTIATGLFGFATSIAEMILFRCIAGVFAGTIVTIRTMVAEHSTSKTQARAFSWFGFSGNLGLFLGPLLGGALADPVHQYPGAFDHIRFFQVYPYALSSLVVALVGATAAVSSALWVEETLKTVKVSPEGEEVASDSPTQTGDLSTWELIKAPDVGIVLYIYGHLMVLAFAFTAIVPVFWFTPVSLGGYGFTPRQISLMMGLNGAAQAAWLLLIFPPLQRRIGTAGVIRLCAAAYPFFFLLNPVGNVLLRQGTDASERAFWIITPITLAVGCGVSMSFTAIQLSLNDVAPSAQTLGTLNALALTGVSGLRAFCPALFTTLFALGANTQLAGGYAIWILLSLIAGGLSLAARYLPELKTPRRQTS